MNPYRTPATMPPAAKAESWEPTVAERVIASVISTAIGGVVNVLVWGYSPMVFFDVGITFALMMVWHWRHVRRLAR